MINQSNFEKIIQHKKQQSSDNQELIFRALDKLDREVSSSEIEKYLKEQAISTAIEEFERKYSEGQIDGQNKDSFITTHSKSMDLRTIQRWLKSFLIKGYVIRKHNKYILSITGKRELQFREYAESYGTISLNRIMHFLLPTEDTLDRNLVKIVEVFGVYVVYALIQATRLIVANKKGQEEHWHSSFFEGPSNFRDGKFREGRLVNRWVKDIFDPWYMLNMFLTAVSNSASDSKAHGYKKQKTLLKERLTEDLSTRIEGIPIESILGPKTDNHPPEVPPSTLDLVIRRFANQHGDKESAVMDNRNEYLRYLSIRSKWCDNDSLLYELDSGTIAKLENSLNKEYHVYSGCLRKVKELFHPK